MSKVVLGCCLVWPACLVVRCKPAGFPLAAGLAAASAGRRWRWRWRPGACLAARGAGRWPPCTCMACRPGQCWMGSGLGRGRLGYRAVRC